MHWMFVSVLAAPGLTERNSASHGVWWVALAIVGVMVLVVTLDLLGRLRESWSNWRAGIPRADRGPAGFSVHPPDSELRDRHFAEHPTVGRDRKPNDPAPRPE